MTSSKFSNSDSAYFVCLVKFYENCTWIMDFMELKFIKFICFVGSEELTPPEGRL